MANTVCTSCKRLITNVTGTVQFKCPSCDQHTLVRCSHCRTLAAKYYCPGCKFEGPN